MIEADGTRLLSQKIPNDEPALLELIAAVLKLAGGDEVIWATDLNHGGPALLIAILVAHGQNILYIPGRVVHHAPRLYLGEGKTDTKDAAVIADQARTRRDLQPLRAGDEISTGLRILTTRRRINPRTGSGRSTACRPSCSNTSPDWSGLSTTADPRQPCCCSPDTGPRTGSAAPDRPGSRPG